MIEAFYEIPNRFINKNNTWYSVKNKIIYARNIKAKYYLEVIRRTEKDIEYLILLSNDRINNNFRHCHIDNYGRLKIKLFHHSEYLNNCLDKDSNINFDYVDTEKENDSTYIVYKVSVN